MRVGRRRTAVIGRGGAAAAAAAKPGTPAGQDASPSPAAIREHLATLLEDGGVQASARRKKLLAYLVEQTLAGQGARLKGFDLAVAVFGRDERFDPQTDPTVRIEVGKLRRDLEQYYLTAGATQSIRIGIPKGHYAAIFSTPAAGAEPEPEPEAPDPAVRGAGSRYLVPWRAAAALCVLLAVAGIWRLATWRTDPEAQRIGPALVVQAFEPLGGGEGSQLLAAGLTSGLLSELTRFEGIQVFVGAAAGAGAASLPPAAAGVPVYIVAGQVDRGPGRVRVNARMTDASSAELLWSRSFERSLTTTDIFDVQTELAGAIVGALAQSNGVITQAAARQLGRSMPSTLFAYDCVQRAFAYRRSFAKDAYPPVRACLEEAVRRDPDYAAAWAMLAFAHLDAVRYDLADGAARPRELRAGLAAAERAVELAPGGITALQSLAALRYSIGDFEEAERVQRQAIALSPNNPESLAQLGWRLAVRGDWKEGRRLLDDAIARSVVVPSWYYTALAIARYLGGDLAGARDAADAGKGFAAGYGPAILAVTEVALGHDEAARAALEEASRQSPLLARDPVAFWANFQIAPSVIERFDAGLAKAGLILPQQAGAF